MVDKRNPTLWSCDNGDENLTHGDIHDAIEKELEDRDDPLIGTLTVYGYARMTPDVERPANRVVDDLIEHLDEDYGSPDDATEVTASMRAASRTFVQAILSEYSVWGCEEVCQREVDVADWVQRHRPDWLKDKG